jgi:hypothetical protein
METVIEKPRSFQRSESIAKIAEALSKAQGEIRGAVKDAANPFFKSKYADLASVMDACKKPLSENGLAIVQFPRTVEGGVEVETMLAHSSGEWMCESLFLPTAKYDAQGIGSAITYARRYALSSIAGVCPEDDDGNAAAASVGKIRDRAMESLTKAAKQGMTALESTWKNLPAEAKAMCKDELPGLKASAAPQPA